jgi:hypothetical protein
LGITPLVTLPQPLISAYLFQLYLLLKSKSDSINKKVWILWIWQGEYGRQILFLFLRAGYCFVWLIVLKLLWWGMDCEQNSNFILLQLSLIQYGIIHKTYHRMNSEREWHSPPTVQIKDSIRMISGRSWGVLKNMLLRKSTHMLDILLPKLKPENSVLFAILLFLIVCLNLILSLCKTQRGSKEHKVCLLGCLLMIFWNRKKILH